MHFGLVHAHAGVLGAGRGGQHPPPCRAMHRQRCEAGCGPQARWRARFGIGGAFRPEHRWLALHAGAERGNFICRAYSGNNIIGRFSDGRYRLSVLYNANKGKFEGANLEIGGKHEPINVSADGKRLYLEVGDHEIGQIIRANGYKWRAWNSAGSVSFDRSTGAAVARPARMHQGQWRTLSAPDTRASHRLSPAP